MITFILRRIFILTGIALLLSYVLWLLTTYDGATAINAHALSALIAGPYWSWLDRVLHGDLGYSLKMRAPVLVGMRDHLLASALVIIPAFVIQEWLAVSIGIASAARHRSPFDRIAQVTVSIFSALPPFWFGLAVLIVLAVNNHVFPFGDLIDLRMTGASFNTPDYWVYVHAHTWDAIRNLAWHLVLPVLTLVLIGLAADTQLVRASMLEILNEDYIRSARARGIKRRAVLWRHGFRNAVLPFITSAGIQFPRLVFAGAIIELVYQIPGLGRLFISAAFNPPRELANGGLQSLPNDPNLVTGYFLVLGLLTLVATLVTDIAYAIADPRIRTGGGGGGAAAPFRAAAPTRGVRIAGRLISARAFALTALAAIVVAGGITVAQNVTAPTPVVDPLVGSWYGRFTYGNGYFSNTQVYLYLDLKVNERGVISGDAFQCFNFDTGTSQAALQLNGRSSTTFVQLDLNNAQDTMQLNAVRPAVGKPMLFEGTDLQGRSQVDVTATLLHGTKEAFLATCKRPISGLPGP